MAGHHLSCNTTTFKCGKWCLPTCYNNKICKWCKIIWCGCNKTQYHYHIMSLMPSCNNKALIFLLVRQHFSARSIFSLRSRSQVLINIPPQFDEGQEKVILSCCLSSHVVTCYDAKSGGLRIEIDRRLLPSIWCKWAFTFVRPSLNPENVCQEQASQNRKGTVYDQRTLLDLSLTQNWFFTNILTNSPS